MLRLLGVFLLFVGITGIFLSVAGAIISYRAINTIGSGLNTSLGITSASLETVGETLVLTKTTLRDVNTSLDTMETTAVDLGRTISETRPLLNQIAQVASEDVPASVETMQAAVPDMAQVAGAIDNTLTTLNRFRIDETILGFRFNYDLGINYNPSVPFDETVLAIGESMEGLPEQLRSLRGSLTVTDQNLEIMSGNVLRIAHDLDVINHRLVEAEPLLDEYSRLIIEAGDNTHQIRANLDVQVQAMRSIITIAMIWLGLAQVAPLYLGWELLTGRRGGVVRPIQKPEAPDPVEM